MEHLGPRRHNGFTFVEIAIVLIVLGALVAIALPSYTSYLDRNKRNQAIQDISTLAMAIERQRTASGAYPANLSALGSNLPSTDPWGTAYQYLAIDVTPAPTDGEKRKDKNMNPLNSDFDLYSMGPDKATAKQLTASNATDDIVRAGNGGFIGLASEN
jgi:general secretion pathway protein G